METTERSYHPAEGARNFGEPMPLAEARRIVRDLARARRRLGRGALSTPERTIATEALVAGTARTCGICGAWPVYTQRIAIHRERGLNYALCREHRERVDVPALVEAGDAAVRSRLLVFERDGNRWRSVQP